MKKQILSGVQPSGILTLGNYLGALKNWVDIQDEYNCRFFIADLHAITVPQEAETLRKNIIGVVMQYLACGLDPKKVKIFLQSDVHEHAELGWLLNNYTYMGELSRMTQYKDKSKKQDNVRVGLFDYPVLMAADILLYSPDYVPVGEDQRQHLELTRDIAIRFNNAYNKEIFKVPEALITKHTARIMSLQDPTKKMSKSDENKDGFISLLDTPDVIEKKIKKAVTDSENKVKYSDTQPGVKNLIDIYSAVTGNNIDQVEQEFDGQGYGQFKAAVAQAVINTLEPIQNRYHELEKEENNSYIMDILKQGAEDSSKIASLKLKDVKDVIGYITK